MCFAFIFLFSIAMASQGWEWAWNGMGYGQSARERRKNDTPHVSWAYLFGLVMAGGNGDDVWWLVAECM